MKMTWTNSRVWILSLTLPHSTLIWPHQSPRVSYVYTFTVHTDTVQEWIRPRILADPRYFRIWIPSNCYTIWCPPCTLWLHSSMWQCFTVSRIWANIWISLSLSLFLVKQVRQPNFPWKTILHSCRVLGWVAAGRTRMIYNHNRNCLYTVCFCAICMGTWVIVVVRPTFIARRS